MARRLASILLLASLICAGVALAAKPVKGGSYSGMLSDRQITVSFKVSASGKSVTKLRITDLPFYCEGGGRITPIKFKNTAVSKQGTFTSTGRFVISEGPNKGQVGANLKITGKFKRGRKESGTLKTTYPKSPECTGKSTYSTSAA
jgi:hypothetical protein